MYGGVSSSVELSDVWDTDLHTVAVRDLSRGIYPMSWTGHGSTPSKATRGTKTSLADLEITLSTADMVSFSLTSVLPKLPVKQVLKSRG